MSDDADYCKDISLKSYCTSSHKIWSTQLIISGHLMFHIQCHKYGTTVTLYQKEAPKMS